MKRKSSGSQKMDLKTQEVLKYRQSFRVPVKSFDELPQLADFIIAHLANRPGDTLEFLRAPLGYLNRLGFDLSAGIKRRFEKKVRPALGRIFSEVGGTKVGGLLRITPKLVSKSFRLGDKVTLPEKEPLRRVGFKVKHRAGKAGRKSSERYDAPVVYAAMTEALTDASGNGNFDAILQIAESFYASAYRSVLPWDPGVIFSDFQFTGWFFLFVRLNVKFVDPELQTIFAVDPANPDSVSITGRYQAGVQASGDGRNWQNGGIVNGTYVATGTLQSFADVKITSPLLPGGGLDIPNVVAGNLAGKVPTIASDGGPFFTDIFIAAALREYFTNHWHLLPVIGRLPSLGLVPNPQIPLNFQAFGKMRVYRRAHAISLRQPLGDLHPFRVGAAQRNKPPLEPPGRS